LLFTVDRLIDIVIALPIDKTDRIVLIGKAFVLVSFVLKNSQVEIVGHTDVEGTPGTALEDVDVEAIFAGHTSKLPA